MTKKVGIATLVALALAGGLGGWLATRPGSPTVSDTNRLISAHPTVVIVRADGTLVDKGAPASSIASSAVATGPTGGVLVARTGGATARAVACPGGVAEIQIRVGPRSAAVSAASTPLGRSIRRTAQCSKNVAKTLARASGQAWPPTR